MNKVDSTATVLNSSNSKKGYTTLLKDLKALLKVGIINSNVMTAFGGFWLALYYTGNSINDYWGSLLLSMIGTGMVIAGACILNNYYDRDIDPLMARTSERPSVTGSIPLNYILFMGIVSTIIGLGLLFLSSPQAAFFGAVGWFAYFILYTIWSKRRYTINTAIGSLSGAIPPLIGWASVDPNLHISAFVLFLIMFIWQTPHFLALAIKKNDDYKNANIPMLPAVYGFAMTKRQMVIYVSCLLPLPLFLHSLGIIFIVIATLLNIGWLLLGLKGFFMKDDLKWANGMFIYSLFYLTVFFLVVISITIPSVVG